MARTKTPDGKRVSIGLKVSEGRAAEIDAACAAEGVSRAVWVAAAIEMRLGGAPPPVAPARPSRSRRASAPPPSAPVAPAGTAVFAEPGAPPVVTAPVPSLPPAVKPSLRRASDLQAPPRCPHPGTRQIGGWCAKCQATVSIGGKLPDGWVKPEGWPGT